VAIGILSPKGRQCTENTCAGQAADDERPAKLLAEGRGHDGAAAV
jgi:hypothetical protein